MRFLLYLFIPVALWAQSDPFRPYAQIRDYLGLTASQQAVILANIREQEKTDLERQVRIQQLRYEIVIETAVQSPDPTAIGTREVEIELTCRIIDSEAKALADKNLAVLTDAQKTKLKALEEAMKLAPTISGAQQLKLLPVAPVVSGNIIPASRFSPGTGTITPFLNFSSSCAVGPSN
ncbi:MAG: hypothetical protein HY820_20540 [Acidobacteria bacterium]|nr:hypothetical protein [Acidobacteriota bacterium]